MRTELILRALQKTLMHHQEWNRENSVLPGKDTAQFEKEDQRSECARNYADMFGAVTDYDGGEFASGSRTEGVRRAILWHGRTPLRELVEPGTAHNNRDFDAAQKKKFLAILQKLVNEEVIPSEFSLFSNRKKNTMIICARIRWKKCKERTKN